MGVRPRTLADVGLMARVLLTGHKGYLGTVMAPVLAAAGHEIVGLDSGLFEACVLGPAPDDPPGVRLDIRDVEPSHLDGFDAVIHLAALSNDPLGDLEPEQTYDINLDASVRLAKLAHDAGVSRFLHSSSCSVYGTASPDELATEDAPMRPVTPYATSKVRVEEALHGLADDSFSPVYMRNATVYGWSPRLRVDLVLNNLVALAWTTGVVRVLSDGTPWRPLVHALDVAAAFAAALDAPRDMVHDQAFNVGTARDNHQVRDLAAIVADTVPGCTVEITGETGADPRSYRVDFGKIARHLPGFRPQWDAAAGARELFDRYREHGLTADDVALRFTRLRWLAALRDTGEIDGRLRWTT